MQSGPSHNSGPERSRTAQLTEIRHQFSEICQRIGATESLDPAHPEATSELVRCLVRIAPDGFEMFSAEEGSVRVPVRPHIFAAAKHETHGSCLLVQLSEPGSQRSLMPATAFPMVRPLDEGAVGLVLFMLGEDGSNDLHMISDRINRPAALLSSFAFDRELAKFRGGNLEGYFGDRLQWLLKEMELEIAPVGSPIRPGEVCSGSDQSVLSVELEGGDSFIIEVGRLPEKQVCGVLAAAHFPREGNTLTPGDMRGGAHPRPRSLVATFPEAFGEVLPLPTEDMTRAEQQLATALKHRFADTWRSEWEVEVLAHTRPRGNPHAILHFVRIVDDDLNSVLPVLGRPFSLLNELYAGYVGATSATGEDRSPSILGVVLPVPALILDLKRLTADANHSIFAHLFWSRVVEDLKGRGILTPTEEGEEFSILSFRAILFNQASHGTIFAISARHDLGEHIYFLNQRPSGVIFFEADIRARYFIPWRRGIPDLSTFHG